MKNKILACLLFLSISVFANDTCIEFCGSCMSKSDSPACAKVELLCKCSEIISNLKDDISEAPIDSVSADSVQNTDTVVADTDTNTVDSLTSDTTVAVIDSTAEPPQDTIEQDSSTQNAIADSTASDTILAVIEPTTPQHVEIETKKEQRNFYKGITLNFELFQEREIANYEVKRINDFGTDHMGATLGFLLRWYFYRWGSFQTGLNAVYHHADYYFNESDLYSYEADKGEGELEYHSIALEIPLEFRFGFPLGSAKEISPFVSLNTLIRKPLYAWIPYSYVNWRWQIQMYDYYGFYNEADTYYTWKHERTSLGCDGAFSAADWDFLEYLGFGIEFYRHVSIQWQILLLSLRTNVDEPFAYVGGIASWRINMDFAW